jgi:hypothetical protein
LMIGTSCTDTLLVHTWRQHTLMHVSDLTSYFWHRWIQWLSLGNQIFLTGCLCYWHQWSNSLFLIQKPFVAGRDLCQWFLLLLL